MKKSTILFLLALLGFSQSIAQTDGPLPIVREGVKWVNEKVIVNHGDTTRYYYTYEICGEDSIYPFDEETGPFKACYYYTGEKWDDAHNYDLCLESSKLGFEKCCEIIKGYMKVRFDGLDFETGEF